MRKLVQSAIVRRIAFFVVVLIALLPLFWFHVTSMHYQSLYGMPQVEGAVLDLSKCNLSGSHGVPLSGAWEFYYNRLIGGGAERPEPDFLAQVPLTWHEYDQYGVELPASGACSYRMTLLNCPGDIPLTVYIANLDSPYRIYLNGVLIARRAAYEFEGADAQIPQTMNVYNEFREGLILPEGSTAELVVELQGGNVGGLYAPPRLSDARLDLGHSELDRFISAAYVGILALCMLWFAAILLIRGWSVPSAALLVLDVLVLARIMLMDEFYEITQLFLPFLRQFIADAVIQALTLFLPLVFLFSACQIIRLEISRRAFVLTALYQAVFVAMSLWGSLSGRLYVRHIFCELSYLSMLYVLYKLYRSVMQGTPYALTVVAICLLSTAGMMGADLKTSGILLIRITLFPATCFVFSMLLQLSMYLRKNKEMQRKALEAETLTLQLRDSRQSLMLSQIRPHFLYNTLLAIHMLCLQAPTDAAEAVLTFANYLRTNMRFIASDKPISFAQELSHITNYAAIEKLRFEDRLTFQMEVETTAFFIPPLTIQPIVENAIKHGACKNILGGTVCLRTYEEETAYIVLVADDGPGFDVSLLEREQADSFGLNNIRFRLTEQVGAKMEIRSTQDSGTTVLVRIPKEGGNESHTDG